MEPSLDRAVEELRGDRNHGASWLARRAVEALVDAVLAGADPFEAGLKLATARPAMGAIAGAIGRVLASGRTPELVVREAEALISARDRAAKAIAVLLRPRVVGSVMTHSASATVREALIYAQPEHVICTVTEPYAEGRDFARELSAEGLAVELVEDLDAADAVTRADLLLLGADTVFSDGTLVNRAGTRDLTRAAKAAGVPVVVACETFKLAPHEAEGIGDGAEQAFDVTPPSQIDEIVTEEGAYATCDVRALVDQTPFLREGYAILGTAFS